ncbi:hypothetical protein SBBP2_2980003 [Burkholderiales bacterium]|nr:hypothetical protein SBBP2_2980003 [Burkholderiales bacterium]
MSTCFRTCALYRAAVSSIISEAAVTFWKGGDTVSAVNLALIHLTKANAMADCLPGELRIVRRTHDVGTHRRLLGQNRLAPSRSRSHFPRRLRLNCNC